MPTRLALVIVFLAILPAAALAAPGNTYYGRLDFSGTSSANTNFYIQLRDVSGTVQCATSDPFFLPTGTTAEACRDTVALGWRIIDGGCWTNPNTRCRTVTYQGAPAIIIEIDGGGFTVFASTDGSSWTQVTSGSPYGFGSGLQIGVGADTGSNVPTLTEWGLILLVGLLGLSGLAAVRRRAPVHP